jgi:hypothetical protein
MLLLMMTMLLLLAPHHIGLVLLRVTSQPRYDNVPVPQPRSNDPKATSYCRFHQGYLCNILVVRVVVVGAVVA